MTDRTVPFSARIPSDDATFLASLQIEGAVTPSDKLRAIITQARKQHEGTGEYAASLQWMRDLLTPALARIRKAEHSANMHSEIINLIIEWIPQIVAFVLTTPPAGPDGQQKLVQLEEALTQRCFQLLEALLRQGVTARAAAYNGDVINSRLSSVIELTQIIVASHKFKEV